MRKNYYADHQNLLKQFKLTAQKEFPEMRIFDRHVGLFFTRSKNQIKVGIKGQSDLWGIIRVDKLLVHLEFEVKTGKAVQTKEQKAWQKFIEKNNGIYILVRNVDTAIAELRAKIE